MSDLIGQVVYGLGLIRHLGEVNSQPFVRWSRKMGLGNITDASTYPH